MKASEKLYNINRQISLNCVAMKKELSITELCIINKELSKIIKEVRELEK